MSWQLIKAKREKRGQLLVQMKAILNAAEKENRSLTAEENANFDKFNGDAEAILGDISRLETMQAAEANSPTEARSAGAPNSGTNGPDTPEGQEQTKKQERAYDMYLRGTAGPEELRTLTVTSQGGVVAPRGMYPQIVATMLLFSGVRMAGATIIKNSKGNDYTIPVSNDNANEGKLVDEGATDTTEAEPSNGVKTMKGYVHQSKWIKVSTVLLEDAEYDVQGYIYGVAGERNGRTFNRYSTIGTGTGQPEGFLTGGTLGKLSASPTAISYEELLDLIHSVDAAYRNSGKCRLQLHDTTLSAVRKLKDGDNRYIFNPGIAGQPDLIIGHPYIVNNHMPQLSDAEGKVIAFGDFSRYFVNDVSNVKVRVARELFVQSGQVGFMVETRHDGKVADATAIKYLQLIEDEE